jgi:hypothetical protein
MSMHLTGFILLLMSMHLTGFILLHIVMAGIMAISPDGINYTPFINNMSTSKQPATIKSITLTVYAVFIGLSDNPN